MVTKETDAAKTEAFAGKMMGILNAGFLAPVISVGHRLELFDELSASGPVTSDGLAERTGLHNRYVREWLGAMVVGGLIEYEPESQRYGLPAEHAAFLTRAAGPDNMAGFTQYVALVGNVEDLLIDAFRNGGGVPYSAYPKFQELQAEESARLFDAALVDGILPMSGVVDQLVAGADVADLGTGSGHAVTVMANEYKKSRFTGFDFSDEGVAAGRREVNELGLENAAFVTHDLARPLPGKYDLITAFDVIHDLAKPREVLKNIVHALTPGGVFLMMDMAASSKLEENIDHPLGPLMYSASIFHCMTVSLSQGGEGLGTVWGEQKAQSYLKDAGFGQIEVNHIEGDPFHVVYACRI